MASSHVESVSRGAIEVRALECPISTPDIRHDLDKRVYRPSWKRSTPFINEEHEGIHGAVEEIRGWLAPADAFKLYEMAYHSGGVILEIGVFAGKSATVELRGAVAASRDGRGPTPQYFGLDVSPKAIVDGWETLEAQGLDSHALLYRGDLRQFFHDLPITPTMVFVDGSHVYPGIWADLHILSNVLADGTPVLCHDFVSKEPGVREAVTEWIDRGPFVPYGAFACSILLVANSKREPKAPRQLRSETFAQLRTDVRERYESAQTPGPRLDITDLTEVARQELQAPQ